MNSVNFFIEIHCYGIGVDIINDDVLGVRSEIQKFFEVKCDAYFRGKKQIFSPNGPGNFLKIYFPTISKKIDFGTSVLG